MDSPGQNFSKFRRLLFALTPSIFGTLLLWKVDPRGGDAVTALFLFVNLICSIAIGIMTAKTMRKSRLIRVLTAFIAGFLLFFVSWAVLIIADLFFFNPIRW